MITNPHMLPKVRSEALRAACAHMPCSLRIASFAGVPCADQSTVVGCHLPIFGKGMSTKVTDLAIAAGCSTCHDLLDWERDQRGRYIREKYGIALFTQLMKANHETIARWLSDDLIIIPKGEVIH